LDPGIVDRTTKRGHPYKSGIFFVGEGNQSEMPCIYFLIMLATATATGGGGGGSGSGSGSGIWGVIKRSRKTMLFRWWSGELHHLHWGGIFFKKIDMNWS
jgi:hypothetical protein